MTPSGNPAPPTESFNTNNQIMGASYDQAGKLQLVNGNTLGYDFDDRLTNETDGVTKAVATYVYDGDGHRVEKYNTSSGTLNYRTIFVYDALGWMAAEYGTAQNAVACITCVGARHDYLPFGEEVAANAFGRDGHWGSGNDGGLGNGGINQKFTAKERDSESGLDYFGARYYGSALGRFTSPDDGSDQHPEDPQSWNLYAYVRNNPLNKTDPDGRDCLQGVSSCANYVAGGLMAIGNIPSDLYNAPNRIVDAGLSLFTSFRIGDAV